MLARWKKVILNLYFFLTQDQRGRIPTDAKYMNPRISFDGLNWWISVCVEFPDCRETLNDDGVGIDLGIKDLAVCSDAVKYKNINKSQKVKKLEK